MLKANNSKSLAKFNILIKFEKLDYIKTKANKVDKTNIFTSKAKVILG